MGHLDLSSLKIANTLRFDSFQRERCSIDSCLKGGGERGRWQPSLLNSSSNYQLSTQLRTNAHDFCFFLLLLKEGHEASSILENLIKNLASQKLLRGSHHHVENEQPAATWDCQNVLGIPRKLRVGLDPTSPGSKRSKHRVGPHTPSRGVMSRAWEALPLTHLVGYRIANWPTQRINGEECRLCFFSRE